MIVDKFDFRLKDGRIATVCSPKEKYAQSMIDYLYKSAEETEFIIRYPEECSKYTLEKEIEFINRVNNSDNEAMVVCLVEEKVVGTCGILWSNNLKIKHRARIGIAILKEFWNQGIGTTLMKEAIKIAEKNKDIIQIELDFVEGNKRAKALYEKMGFKIVGIKPNAIRLKDGTLLDEYSMIKEIR
ncbi:MAG TPA: GNAT family N-acetyltransferase [Erysipelotrichaceae bacterium]|jgi:RimJ/RimL family protein N-acetyltransferase|nr:GNAT family N-acetyltransferase [Erysipelotrichia bacterium]HPX33086.1 GNAT family N-acetyltransferase [Erysipelotrichaceae bacterium]HQA84366.1 GNAT family N-acetyltransferase [Erysipelotrichaceae bacterium]